MKWYLLFFYFLSVVNGTSITCSGHDGCKGQEWIGSYDVTCNGGERICHNTVLKCGRQSCSITVSGSGHDAYQNSVVYAQNIKSGGKFELKCLASGQRKCKNNIIYCPREEGTECVCSNCDSSTKMYYKYGTKYITGGSTARRFYDGPIVCKGRSYCDIDERTYTRDYASATYYSLLWVYPPSSDNRRYTLSGTVLKFKDCVGEWYKSWRHTVSTSHPSGYIFTLYNYSDYYPPYPRYCERRSYTDLNKVYAYRPNCEEFLYGNPYEGFWVLGEPAQSCTDACLLYNMTCDKKQHIQHLHEINTNAKLKNILKRFNMTCDSYTTGWLNGHNTPVYNALTRQCALTNTTRTGDQWFCNTQPLSNNIPSEDKRRLCWCAPTTEKPQKVCELNKTRWLNETIVHVVNKTHWMNKTLFYIVNKTRWINKTVYHFVNKTIWNVVDRIRWKNRTVLNVVEKIKWKNKTVLNIVNKTVLNFVNKTLLSILNKTHWNNKTTILSKGENCEKGEIPLFGSTVLAITTGGFGIVSFCFSFYVAWHCWLRERLKELILEYCCCGLGEYVLECWKFMGWIGDWKSELEEKEDLKEMGLPERYKYAGLTLTEIGEIKKAEQINKIRLKEAVKINWDELKKSAIKIEIPIFKPKPLQEIIETHEEEYAVKDDSPSGTPRRRRALI